MPALAIIDDIGALAFLASGVHPTLAGVAIALLSVRILPQGHRIGGGGAS